MSIKNFKKIIKELDKDILYKLFEMSNIENEHIKILKMKFIDNVSLPEICRTFSISKSTYINIINESIARLESTLYTIINVVYIKYTKD